MPWTSGPKEGHVHFVCADEASYHTEADFEFSPFASLAQSQENTSPSLPRTADDSGHQSTQNRNLEQSESLI